MVAVGIRTHQLGRPIRMNRSEDVVIGEKMVEPQVLDGAVKLPDRDAVPSKLGLGVREANLHRAQFFTRCSLGVDALSSG
jgi:hypothetical protein